MLKATHQIFVSRTDTDSRRTAVAQMIDRVKDNRLAPVVIVPEGLSTFKVCLGSVHSVHPHLTGLCTNQKALISFKQGSLFTRKVIIFGLSHFVFHDHVQVHLYLVALSNQLFIVIETKWLETFVAVVKFIYMFLFCGGHNDMDMDRIVRVKNCIDSSEYRIFTTLYCCAVVCLHI